MSVREGRRPSNRFVLPPGASADGSVRSGAQPNDCNISETHHDGATQKASPTVCGCLQKSGVCEKFKNSPKLQKTISQQKIFENYNNNNNNNNNNNK